MKKKVLLGISVAALVGTVAYIAYKVFGSTDKDKDDYDFIDNDEDYIDEDLDADYEDEGIRQYSNLV